MLASIAVMVLLIGVVVVREAVVSPVNGALLIFGPRRYWIAYGVLMVILSTGVLFIEVLNAI